MANMQKPVLANPVPFDAKISYSLKFNYSGDQIFKKELEITNSDSGVKQTLTSESRTLYFVIPANTLSNGGNYYATLKVYNIDNDSITSDPIYFKCFATPNFIISSPTNGQDIKNTYVDVVLSYSQEQNEPLDSFDIILYDNNMSEISRSGIIYTANLSEGQGLAYSFLGLNNKTQFNLQAVGRTKNGMSIQTDTVSFYTDYISSSGFSAVYANNDNMTGNITITSHFIAIDGRYDGSAKYKDGAIILTDGTPVIYDEGFQFEADFALQIKFSGNDFNCNVPIVKINEDVILLIKQANIYGKNAGKYVAELQAGKNIKYVIFSNYFTPTDSWLISIKRISDFYSILVTEVTE